MMTVHTRYSQMITSGRETSTLPERMSAESWGKGGGGDCWEVGWCVRKREGAHAVQPHGDNRQGDLHFAR